jgi:hypothetical protein
LEISILKSNKKLKTSLEIVEGLPYKDRAMPEYKYMKFRYMIRSIKEKEAELQKMKSFNISSTLSKEDTPKKSFIGNKKISFMD